MEHKPHIHCIGIGGIGISALARYYLARGYRVTGTNLGHSPLLDTLTSEGIEVVENGAMIIDRETTKIIYTEAIIDDETLGLDGVRAEHLPEISVAQFYHIPLLSYPEALAEVFHTFPIKIAVAGAHGKSTTSAMIGTLLHDNQSPATTITGTLVKAFGGKNICVE
jgi:UDP-N-acetylmuramate--alanine ligase